MSLARDMEKLFTRLHTMLHEEKYEAVDHVLHELEGHPILVVGALRATFAAKDRLPAWHPLLERMRGVLGKTYLLRGLT